MSFLYFLDRSLSLFNTNKLRLRKSRQLSSRLRAERVGASQFVTYFQRILSILELERFTICKYAFYAGKQLLVL